MRGDSGGLWAITSYFNPAGFARRIANYREFRKHLAVPLVAVELSFDGRFELRSGDADVLLQICGGSVLWQKERLLNAGLARIPAHCRALAWLDADVIFETDEWVERTVRALEAFDLIHLFHERHDLPRDVGPERLRAWTAPPTSQSAVFKMTRGEAEPDDFFAADAPLERHTTVGLAWASPRTVLERHGWYDACILGSGCRAILSAALGRFTNGERATLMNARQAEHYRRWAEAYHETVRGRVGCIPGRLFHLWHGELKDRRYGDRHRGLTEFNFDPFTDIAPDPGGAWRWNSDKTDMHAFIKRYFELRKEDGAP